MNLQPLTLAELDTLESDISAERARRAGHPLNITSRDIDRPCPSYGWLLDVTWAVSDLSYVDWYPTEDAARAALHQLAAGTACVEGDTVDLTSPGCHYSGASIRPVVRPS